MGTRQAFIQVVLWGTRALGALFVVGGVAFFVTAWVERSVIPIAMGVITIGFGVWAASVRATSMGGLDSRRPTKPSERNIANESLGPSYSTLRVSLPIDLCDHVGKRIFILECQDLCVGISLADTC